MKGWRRALAALALGTGLLAAAPARADFTTDAGWGLLTVLSNVGYMPAKITYATLGGLTGGIVYALTGGEVETAQRVWVPSMGGTYVLTPRMLQGVDPIAFAALPPTVTATLTAEPTDAGRPRLQEEPIARAGSDRR
jgi:hypothetical protein